jgi:hypothetical protein
VTSDLWLPTLMGLSLLWLVLSLPFFWAWLRVWYFKKRLHTFYALHTEPSQQPAPECVDVSDGGVEHYLNKFRTIFDSVGDLAAFTAQKNPVVLEERLEPLNYGLYEAANNQTSHLGRVEPAWSIEQRLTLNEEMNEQPITIEPSNATLNNPPTLHVSDLDTVFEATSLAAPLQASTQLITTLVPAAIIPELLVSHELFHYQVRLFWQTEQGKDDLSTVLREHPWLHITPVSVCLDMDSNQAHSVVLAWQIIHRRYTANAYDLAQFKQWCATLAVAAHANYEFISPGSWDSLIAEAHSLLSVLDSAIIVKMSVPSTQLDLFTHSLLAARFVQEQEHWAYYDAQGVQLLVLERLWQTDQRKQHHQPGQVDEVQPIHAIGLELAASPSAHDGRTVFQLIIDLPHLEILEARKIYMRLRAVARTSAVILQAANGTSLSEGMLDRYSREMLLKQESLTNAGVVPGSILAQTVFQPQIKLNQDIYRAS